MGKICPLDPLGAVRGEQLFDGSDAVAAEDRDRGIQGLRELPLLFNGLGLWCVGEDSSYRGTPRVWFHLLSRGLSGRAEILVALDPGPHAGVQSHGDVGARWWEWGAFFEIEPNLVAFADDAC